MRLRVQRSVEGPRLVGDGDDVELANRFLSHLAARNYADASCRGYAYDLLNFLRFLDERGLRLGEVTPTDVFDTIVYANPAFAALLDAPDPATLIGPPTLSFVVEARGSVAHQLESVESGAGSIPTEQRWTSLAGRQLWVAVSNVAITHDGQPVVLQFAFDVTARRAAENALREAKDLFESAFSNAIGVALVSLDPRSEGRYLQVNEALGRLLGYPQDELVGRSVLDLVHPDDGTDVVASLRQVATTSGQQYRADQRYLRADGHPIWVRVHASTVQGTLARRNMRSSIWRMSPKPNQPTNSSSAAPCMTR